MILVLVLVLLLMSGLAAFTSGRKAGKADQKAVTLDFATEVTFRANLKEPYAEFVKVFEERNPNIKINTYGYPLNEFHSKIITEIAAGNAPDLCQSVAMTFFSHAKVGKGYMDIGDKVREWGYLGGNAFSEAMMSDWMIDGKIASLPFGGVSWGYAYWKSMFDEAGVKVGDLETWDDLIAAAKKITKGDRYGLGLTNGGGQYDIIHWEQLSWSMDGGFFPSDAAPYTADRVSVNSPASVHAMQLMADAFHKHKVSAPGVWTSEKASTDLLMSKKAAVVFVHGGMIGGFKFLKPDEFEDIGWMRKMDVVFQGKRYKPGVNIGWQSMGIRNEIPAEKLEAAYTFMQFFGSEEAQTIIAEGGQMPIRKDVAEKLDPVKLNYVSDFFNFHNNFYKHNPRHSNLKKREMYSVFKPLFQQILVEGKPVNDVMDQAQAEIVKVVKK
jgi:multiple sugar transport system substrate-binding protein